MADLTVYAEALISAVARAFYDDECIVLIDRLISQKYLRDDDMGQRFNLPSKKLRSTLQFLQEEHIVRIEEVDDLAQGGSQTTKFYYIDYNRAVHSIRLRLHILRKQLEASEIRARSNSYYLCPGYKERRCNGRYTEEEVQQMVDVNTGLFLCQECYTNLYMNHPNPPPIETYTLKLIDNTKDLRIAMDNIRRLSVQLSAKFVGNQQIRPGIYDLLQKVRGNVSSTTGGKGNNGGGGNSGSNNSSTGNNINRAPITSNYPSENFALGIGSKRLAGTGRTAGIRAKKLEQQGVAESALHAKTYLVNGVRTSMNNRNDDQEIEYLFLKNALGYEMQFIVERGSGARAQLLVSNQRRYRYLRKLLDAAALKVGTTLPLPIRVEEIKKRKLQLLIEAHQRKMKSKNGSSAASTTTTSTTTLPGATLPFLDDNIGRLKHEISETFSVKSENDNVVSNSIVHEKPNEVESDMVLIDDTEELRRLSDEARIMQFQSHYQVEMDRQAKLLQLEAIESSASTTTHFMAGGSPQRIWKNNSLADEDTIISWEDGEVD